MKNSHDLRALLRGLGGFVEERMAATLMRGGVRHRIKDVSAILQTWGSSSPFTTRVSALGSRLNSSSLSDDGAFDYISTDYIWTGSGRDWVHDAVLRDLRLDFNYNLTIGDQRYQK